MTKHARSIVICLAFALLAAGCGLPTVAYLYPPQYMSVDNAGLSVKNDPRNYESSEGTSQTYKGIEIFYRIYQNENAASAMVSTTLPDLVDSYADNPDSLMSLLSGSSYKFSRLRNSYSRSEPLIPIDASDESSFYINISSTADWLLTDDSNTPLLDSSSNDISIMVRTLDSTSSDVRFSEKDFNAGDDDYNGTTGSSSDTYYIVLFSVSYGLDQSTIGQTVYSMPYIPTSYVEY